MERDNCCVIEIFLCVIITFLNVEIAFCEVFWLIRLGFDNTKLIKSICCWTFDCVWGNFLNIILISFINPDRRIISSRAFVMFVWLNVYWVIKIALANCDGFVEFIANCLKLFIVVVLFNWFWDCNFVTVIAYQIINGLGFKNRLDYKILIFFKLWIFIWFQLI